MLPSRVVEALLPGVPEALCGLALGIPRARFSPAEGVLHEARGAPLKRDGSAYDSDEVVSDVRAVFSLGRLVRVDATIDVAREVTEAAEGAAAVFAAAEQLAEAFTAAGRSLRFKKKPKSWSATESFTQDCGADGERTATLTITAGVIETGGDPLFRLEVRTALDDDSLSPDEAALPMAEVAGALKRHLGIPEGRSRAAFDELLKEGGMAVRSLLAGWKTADREAVRALTHELAALLARASDLDAAAEMLGDLSVVSGGWLPLPPESWLKLVRLMLTADTDVEERTAWLARTADALAFDDDAALAEVHARLRARMKEDEDVATELRYFGGFFEGPRVFSLAALDLEPAEVAELGLKRTDVAGDALDVLGVPEDLVDGAAVEAMRKPHPADLLSALRQARLYRYLERLDAARARPHLERLLGNPLCCLALADERREVKKDHVVCRVGLEIFTFSASRTQRTRAASEKAARASFARAAGAAKRKPAKPTTKKALKRKS